MEAADRPSVSAIVTTFNEDRNIAECVATLQWCDEILVVDSYSTDRTVDIARALAGVRLLQRTYFGSASQKNWAMDQVSGDWIIIFDADERCTPELRTEIEELLRHGPRHEAYTIRRRAFVMGKPLRFSGWQHDSVIRLFKRGSARYPNKRVHADMITRGPAPLLKHHMLHYMIESFDQYLPRILNYGWWGAAQAWRRGQRSGVFHVFARPVWRFIRMYLVQLGILDGMRGLVFCMLQSYATYLKWATLWEWHENARRGRQPALPPFDDNEETWRFEREASASTWTPRRGRGGAGSRPWPRSR